VRVTRMMRNYLLPPPRKRKGLLDSIACPATGTWLCAFWWASSWKKDWHAHNQKDISPMWLKLCACKKFYSLWKIFFIDSCSTQSFFTLYSMFNNKWPIFVTFVVPKISTSFRPLLVRKDDSRS
jgi:hypothetical protein